MIQVFTGTIASLAGGWNGEDVAPFVVWSGDNPLAGASTFRMPTAGTLRNLHVKIDPAFGAGTSGTFRFTLGGSAQSLSVTIADSATSGSDTSNSVAVSADNEIAIDLVRSGSTADVMVWFSFEFETTEANESIYCCSGDLSSFRLGGTAYNTPLGGSSWENVAVAQKGFGCSAPGSFTTFTVYMTHAPGTGESWTFHLYLDGVLQDGTGDTVDTELVIADSATNGSVTFDLPVTTHQKVAIRAVASSGAAAQWSTNVALLFASSHPSGAQHLAAAQIATPATTTEYALPLGGGRTGLAFDAAESNRVLIGGITPLSISGWTIRLADAPGAIVRFTCRVNGADTGLSITFGPTETTKTVTVSTPIEIGETDTWSVEIVDAGMVNTATPDWTWFASAANSRSNLLTGASHTATGSKNIISGESGTVIGDLVALFNMLGTPFTFTGNNAFIVRAATILLNGVDPSALSLDDLTDVAISSPTSGQVLKYNGSNWENNTASAGGTRTIGLVIDGQGTAISTGVKGFVRVPFSGTITKATLLSTDASATAGDIVIDIWKDTYANYPPTDADSITASAPPTLSAANKYEDSTLAGWTTSVTSGDILGFNVDSVATVTRVLLVLEVTPT